MIAVCNRCGHFCKPSKVDGYIYDCRDYWAENYERYQKALAILNGNEYVIVNNNMEIYI